MTPEQLNEARAVAGKLTEAQRKALAHAPDDCEWMGRGNLGRFGRSFLAMEAHGLTDAATDIGGVFDVRLTPLGLTVRTILQEHPNG